MRYRIARGSFGDGIFDLCHIAIGAMAADVVPVTIPETFAHDLRIHEEAIFSSPTGQSVIFAYTTNASELSEYLKRIHPDDRPKLSEAIENTILYRTVYELRLRHEGQGGDWATVVARGQAVLNDQDEVVGIRGVMIDITRYVG
jgi:PAS domain-containing protein